MANQNTVKGPQLSLNKNFLFMNAQRNQNSFDAVVLKNLGTTTVTYEWKKVHRGDHIASKKSDFVQRFFCHYPRSILKPGEQKTFTFSFKSDKVGMFNEEWELYTEPILLTALSQISLSGICHQQDPYEKSRELFIRNQETELSKVQQPNKDIKNWYSGLKYPKQHIPDLNDPKVQLEIFENNNRHLGLYYTKDTLENFLDIYEDICLRKTDDQNFQQNWDYKVETIEAYINQEKNPYTRKTLHDMYVQALNKARKVPNDRALSFSVINKFANSFVEQTIDFEAKMRAQLDMLPQEGPWAPISEDLTKEQIAEIAKQESIKKQELLKKAKKKPKTEQEEADEIKELINKVTNGLSQQLVDVEVTKCEHEIEILKTEWRMENNLCMDAAAFEKLNRKVSILDIDVADQDVILRADLDVPMTPFVPFKPIEDEFKDFLDQQREDQSSTKKIKKTKKQLEDEADTTARFIEAKKMRQEPWKSRQILDHKLLKRTEASLKYLQEKNVKRVVVLSSIGEPSGRVELHNSVKSLIQPLQGLVQDQPIVYLEDSALENFSTVEESLKEGSVYLLENLNFRPDENSFVKPWVDPDEKENKKKEEAKKIEELPPVDLKKMSAAEKKKYEEELKRREEELAKSQPSPAELAKEAEKKKIKEEEAAKRKKTEYFDYKTTYQYIQNLRKLGQIYVNDAPLASLSTSNSIAEMKCKLNVMGVKMTEDIRKLAQFFIKRFPLEIRQRDYKVPERKNYFNTPFTVVLGGMCKSHQDMLDKILLINSLIEQASQIYLVGDLGLAAVCCQMEQKVLQVDHNNLNFLDYHRFFKKLFQKAEKLGCKLQLPVDFQVAQKISKESQQQEQDRNAQVKSSMQEQDIKASFDAKTKNTNIKKEIPQNPTDKVDVLEKSNDKSFQIWAANPNLHWTDVSILCDQDYVVDIEDQLQNGVRQSIDNDNEKVINKFNPDDHMIQYGPKTINALCSAVQNSYKLFWDGSVSLYTDTAKSSTNNKEFIGSLLEMRTQSDQDQEPPVTLIHGNESEATLRKTLLRIKIDQQEILEALKAKQALEAGESEAEQDINVSESKAEISTFQEDLDTICDFLVADCTLFTTRLLQGVYIKSLYAFDEHRKPTRAEQEEELNLLDKI